MGKSQNLSCYICRQRRYIISLRNRIIGRQPWLSTNGNYGSQALRWNSKKWCARAAQFEASLVSNAKDPVCCTSAHVIHGACHPAKGTSVESVCQSFQGNNFASHDKSVSKVWAKVTNVLLETANVKFLPNCSEWSLHKPPAKYLTKCQIRLF